MLSKIRKFADENKLLLRGDRIVAGISGGADSTALFYVLVTLREERGFSFSVLHVHHGIRGEEADRDEAFVLALARKYDVPARSVRINVPEEAKKMGLGLEEAGRILRRKALLDETDRLHANRIALAHHRDDLAETVLMNLARGTGLAGIAGIRPVSGLFIRPLLCVSREEIEAYLADLGAAFVTDSTNAENEYTRNRVRNEILPALEKYVNPKAGEHIARAAEEAARAYAYMERLALKRYRAKARIRTDAEGEREVLLPEELIAGEDPLIAGLCVRFSFSEITGTLKDITREHAESVLALFLRENGKEVHLPYGLRALRVPEGVLVGKLKKEEPAFEEIPLPVPGCVRAGEWTFYADFVPQTPQIPEEKKYTKWIDYDKIKGNPAVRTRRNGDYIVIHPDGRKKTISNLMTDSKLRRSERDRLPLVVLGQEVLLVPGVRTGESLRVDGGTVRVLRISAKKDGKEETNE